MKKIFALFLCLVLLLSTAIVTYGAGGDRTDPVVSQSYLEQIWKDQFLTPLLDDASAQLPAVYNKALLSAVERTAGENRAANMKNTGLRRAFGRLVLKEGDVLYPALGCKLTLLSGTVTAEQSLINVTAGAPADAVLTPRNLYMQTDAASGGITVRTPAAEFTIDGTYRLTPAGGVNYGSLADALAEMGLFRGTTAGYDLMGSTTRAQGLVMFLRLLGQEEDALKCTAAVPFTDVPPNHWARPYVAYAYEKGLTAGVSAAAFSPDAPVTEQHYLTFLLRALQYAEGTQFSYNTVLSDAATLGLFSPEEIAAMDGTFLRYKMVYLSYYALLAENEQSGALLLESLLADGSVAEAAAYRGLAKADGWRLG